MAAVKRVLHEIYMSRIPFTAGSRELRQHFGQFGPVVRCTVQLNRKTGFHAGFGWVGFAKEDSVVRVLNQEDHIVEGYKIDVQLHDRQKKRPRRSEEDDE
ncbi:SRA stem-loop-interacting RNA-binding protein, mitochondrial [Rana temporaria]|uniref:SRA stem-loop-interacting RNA-binding protein, mitochondrial n=1 Tax=Rana temporaria TaxID=8407 RepID=UPI001AAE1520|nr:SRA stem-loop-interacting RNA-binding protein, mitochondrial [Rana temporaria]